MALVKISLSCKSIIIFSPTCLEIKLLPAQMYNKNLLQDIFLIAILGRVWLTFGFINVQNSSISVCKYA